VDSTADTAEQAPYRFIRAEVLDSLVSDDPFADVESKATRHAYAETIIAVAAENPRVVVLDAGVCKSLGTRAFRGVFPERSFDFGVAEQNMMAAAAGMATTGLIPFASTFAVFATMRALDQVRNFIHYPNLNVKIASSHAGLTVGPDGVSHQGQEDLSIMRAIANSTVVAPSDPVTASRAVWAAAERDGPVYLSLTRVSLPYLFTDEYPFQFGKAVPVREGTDATIIAIRDLVSPSLVAAERLSHRGLEVRVIDCHTLKPLDWDTIVKAAAETGAIVTAESNTINGGLGSAVAEVLVEHCPIPMQRIGVRDTYAESGTYQELTEKYGLSSNHIEEAVCAVVARKREETVLEV
jgi:transketolase